MNLTCAPKTENQKTDMTVIKAMLAKSSIALLFNDVIPGKLYGVRTAEKMFIHLNHPHE